MIRWLTDQIFQNLSMSPEHEIGACVTRQLAAELDRAQKREAELVALLRRIRNFETYATHGGGAWRLEIDKVLGESE